MTRTMSNTKPRQRPRAQFRRGPLILDCGADGCTFTGIEVPNLETAEQWATDHERGADLGDDGNEHEVLCVQLIARPNSTGA